MLDAMSRSAPVRRAGRLLESVEHFPIRRVSDGVYRHLPPCAIGGEYPRFEPRDGDAAAAARAGIAGIPPAHPGRAPPPGPPDAVLGGPPQCPIAPRRAVVA